MSMFSNIVGAIDRYLPDEQVANLWGRITGGQPQDGGDYFDTDGKLIGNGGDASRPASGAPTRIRVSPDDVSDPFKPTRAESFRALFKDIGSDFQGVPSNYQELAQIAPLDRAQKKLAMQRALMQQQSLSGFNAWLARMVGGDPTSPNAGAAAAVSGQPAMAYGAADASGVADTMSGAPGPSGAAGMAGGPAAPTSAASPARGLPSLREMALPLMMLKNAGVDPSDYVQILDKTAPNVQVDSASGLPYDARDPASMQKAFPRMDNINGWNADKMDPKNRGRYFPRLPDGAIPLFDDQGRFSGIKTIDGAIQSAEEMAAAQARGTEGAKAALDVIQVPMPDGSVRSMPRAEAVRLLSGGGAAPARPGGQRGAPGPGADGLGASQAPSDAEYAKGVAGEAAKRYAAMQDAGTKAPGSIGQYKLFADLLGQFEGGALTPAQMSAASVANSLGFHFDKNLDKKQAAQAIGNKLVLDIIGGSLGTGISNADRSFIEKEAPNLNQTAAGRATLVNTAITSLQNQIQLASMARQWQARYGRIDKLDATGKGFDDYAAQWLIQHRPRALADYQAQRGR
jgi:hypothetical protein